MLISPPPITGNFFIEAFNVMLERDVSIVKPVAFNASPSMMKLPDKFFR